MWLVILSMLLGQPQQCNSTIFGMDGDKYAGTRARYLRRPVDPQHDIGVAHRSLPLGSLVLVTVRSRTVVAVVIDRGPYGRIRPAGKPCPKRGKIRAAGTCWVNGAYEYRKCRNEHPRWKHWKDPRCYSKGSWWNGCLDTAPKLAELLDHDGWERANITPIRFIRIPTAVLLRLWGGGNV